MGTVTMGGFVDKMRVVLGGDSLTDGQLLRAFVAERDADAFAALVHRHGPMVLAACRRVLGNAHAAEDAFQATFLVLARKANSVAPREGLAGWLYAVAVHTALRARTMSDRRRKRETPVANVPEPRSSDPLDPVAPEALAALNEELARLPEKYRTAVVLCELQGLSRREVAERLGVPEGTLSSRLAAARKRLADRLRKRGVALSVGAVAGLLADLGLAGAVPLPLSAAATTFGTATPAVPSAVSTLADGVIRTMFLHKLKLTAVGLAVVLVAGLGGSALLRATPKADDPAKPVAVAKAGERPAANKKPAGPGRILFWRRGEYTLMDPDGKNETKLTKRLETTHPSTGSLSPDGKRAVYPIPKLAELAPGERQGQADMRLYVHELGEKEPTELNISGMIVSWSADSSVIAVSNFADQRAEPKCEHFLVNVKTKEKTVLKLPANHIIADWSRDGKLFLTIRFELSDEKRSARLYLMNRDGTENKALTDDTMLTMLGRLSPDGAKVLCSSVPPLLKGNERAEQRRTLQVIDVATGKTTPLAEVPENADVQAYCWSPDGKRIAYTWRQILEVKPEDNLNTEAESFLVIADADGKNGKTVLAEKGATPGHITLGTVDWR